MGIEVLKMPEGQADAGMFNLPPEFDSKRHAAEWVPEAQVVFKQQRQNLIGCGASADGWEIWRPEPPKQLEEEADPDYKSRLGKWRKENAGPITVTGSGNKKFVLMCRPRELQDQVNALFGNVSKKFINREVKGETAAGEQLQDPGMLTEKNLKESGGGTGFEPSELRLNDVTAAVST